MRENNHIANRNSYQNLSSFKIRQPINEQSYINKQKYPTQYCIKQKVYDYNRSIQHEQENSFSSFYDKYPHRNHAQYERKQNSRQLSYNSRGSNATRNSIKMTDYIALQAKNLIQNRDKYKYDGQNHMRSSSMQCYPNSFKVSREQPQKPYKYLNGKQQSSQPTQIPSFGIQCRTTISGGYPMDKSYSASKYPIKSYKLEDPSISRRLQNRNIKTQIDERIERLRASSTSTRHKQRISTIKQIDENRLQNMDKINIKIKNILTTLQQEQDHYKKRFVQNSVNRVKTESNFLKENRNHLMTELDQQTLLSKYTQNNNSFQQQNSYFDNQRQNIANLQHNNIYEDSSMISNKGYDKLCDNNISSYYYYQDESAMIKSSQSPFKSSPQRPFKKYSIQKDKDYSISKYSKVQIQTSKVKIYNESSKPGYTKENQSNSYKKAYAKYQKMDGSLLKNIPECETQIIESKAFEMSNNAFIEEYHTFDSKQSQKVKRGYSQQRYQKQNNDFNLNGDQQNYKTPELHQLQNCYYPYNIDSKRNTLKQQQNDKQIDRIAQYLQNNKGQIKCEHIQQISNNNNKRNHSIYFKIDDQQKYLKSSTRINKSPEQVNNYRCQQFPTLQTKLKQLKEQKLYNRNNQNILTNKYSNNQYLQTFNISNKNDHNNMFEQNNKQFIYSDSIKQTPRIKSIQQNPYQNILLKNNRQYTRNNKVKTEYDQKLNQKLHQYQKRLLKYQKQMSASKIIQSHRKQSNTKSLNSKRQKQYEHSHEKIINPQQNKSYQMIYQFKPQQQQASKNYLANICQQNVQKLLSDVKRQRNLRQNNSNIVQKQFYQTDLQYKKNANLNKQTYFKLAPPPPKYPPYQSHRFGKQDHQKFIQELKKDRQQVYQLSQRKSRFNNCTSVDNPRIQGSNQRSESQNSRISSTTIVKGKNIDEEIYKIQKKMEQYQQMKKQLHLESQPNTQRQTKKEQIKEFNLDSSLNKKVQSINKSPKRQKCVRFNDQQNTNINQKTQKSNNNWLKIVEQKNSYVKVRSSILKQNKSNQIKNYLDQEIQKASNRSKSIGQINDITLTKSRHTLSKQNILPPTTTTIDSPKYPNGSKKIVLGLAQNLILNCIDQSQNIDKEMKGEKSDIKTPKLLRNLKGKLNDVSIVKKKAQKRGFRSQFINDLHQDNQILSSNKKVDLQNENEDVINSTSRYSPQNRQILIQILVLIENQILIDEQFRNLKKMFNAMTKKDKWTILMSEYIRQIPQDRNILLSQIIQIFTLHEQQSNPFYSTRGVDFSLETIVSTYIKCKNNWLSIIKQISDIPYEKLTSCGFSAKCIDIERKGFIQVDDLTRFMNMELNKYYRKRDLWLIWQRISGANTSLIHSNGDHKLKFVDFSKGLGSKIQFM